MLKIIMKTIKALHSDTDPNQLTIGFALGMAMGLTPFWGPHAWLIIALLLLFRFNIATFFVGWGVFKGFAYLLDPVFDSLGVRILEAPALEGLWKALYESPFWLSTKFNNTVLMGSLVVALIAFLPLCVVLRLLILKYRDSVKRYVEKSKIVMFLKGTKFYRAYSAIH